MKIRPTGITLIGLLFLALGALSFLWSLLVFGVGGVSSLFTTIFSFSPTISSSLWSGLLGMLTAAVQFAAGIGLLRLSGWAWYLAIIAVGLSVLRGNCRHVLRRHIHFFVRHHWHSHPRGHACLPLEAADSHAFRHRRAISVPGDWRERSIRTFLYDSLNSKFTTFVRQRSTNCCNPYR